MWYSQSTRPWSFPLFLFNQNSFKIGVLILYLMCTGSYICDCKQTCPDTCTCTGSHMSCPRIPHDFPSNIIRELHVTDFNFNILFPSTFEDGIWTNLTMLDLRGKRGQSIRSRSFIGLKSLVYLGIHGFWLNNIEPSVFEGLENVSVLDLSDNGFLHLDFVLAALDGRSKWILPAMENLTIASLYTLASQSLKFDANFFQIISTRRYIRYLDISNMNIMRIDFSGIDILCNSVEHINARNVSIADLDESALVCQSLRTFDVSDLYLVVLRNIQKFTRDMTLYLDSPFFNNVENLYINGIFEKPFVCESCTFQIKSNLRLKKIEMRRNQLKFLNFSTTRFPLSLRQSLSELDISSNLIEFISADFFYNFKNLEVLNLSNNKLFAMQDKNSSHFQQLLSHSKKLRIFSIAKNKLGYIPTTFFSDTTNLKHIDLSRNRLTSVEFDIQHMPQLKYIDLSYNMLLSLDATILGKLEAATLSNASRRTVGTKYQHNANTQHGMSEDLGVVDCRIDLQSNPFECGCSEVSVQFISLIQNSVALVHGNETYSCRFQGESIDMLTVNLEDVDGSCDLQRLLPILRIVLPILFVLGVIAIVITFLLYRRAVRIRRYNDFLNQLNRGEVERQFLVFMSFCSEDTEFAMKHIAIPLQETLVQLTNRDRNYICIGDKEFRLGVTVHAEVMRCIEESSVVLFIVSNKFCKKGWCRMEVGEAYSQGKPIIMLMKELVEIDNMSNVMKKIFNRYTHASWVKDDYGGHLEPDIQMVGQSVIELAQKDFVEETQV